MRAHSDSVREPQSSGQTVPNTTSDYHMDACLLVTTNGTNREGAVKHIHRFALGARSVSRAISTSFRRAFNQGRFPGQNRCELFGYYLGEPTA